jgi:hypothetical protein
MIAGASSRLFFNRPDLEIRTSVSSSQVGFFQYSCAYNRQR